MQSRTLLVLILAVVCAVSAAVGVNQVLRQLEAKAKLETTTILVAKQDVPRGGVLKAELIAAIDWPAKLVPAGVVTDIEKLKDRTVGVALVKGEPILAGKLIEGATLGSLAGMIPTGMRAFTVSTPHRASGVGGFVEPGNKVDVLLTTSGQTTDMSGGGTTTTLLQNIQVLAVDQNLGAAVDKKGERQEVKTVTLLVTPNQAAKLSLAANKGTLNLSLRHPDDSHEAEAEPATLADLRLHQEPVLPNRTVEMLQQVATSVWDRLATPPSSPQDTVTETAGTVTEPRKIAAPAYIQTLRGTQAGLVSVKK